MKFSFILPAWKGRYLREAITSILAQRYKDFELVVVDDCSPDGIRRIVESFHDERLSYHRNEKNIGGGNLVAQWNHCLTFARGEYVILATDDDLYEPDFLSSFVPLADRYPQADLMRARILQVNASGEIMAIDSCYKEFLSRDEFVYHLLHGMRGGVPQYIFRRQVLVDRGGFVSFPKAWASDDATAVMMAEHGVVTSQEHLVRFRWSDINISGDRSLGREKLVARLQYNEWLTDHVRVTPRGEEWSRFLAHEVNDFLPLYSKLTLISTMRAMPIGLRVGCAGIILQAARMSIKDRLSVLYHSFC